MRPFRFATASATATLCLALLSSTADALPTSVVCPPALNPVAGTAGDDKLGGTVAADCLVGEDGADRIRVFHFTHVLRVTDCLGDFLLEILLHIIPGGNGECSNQPVASRHQCPRVARGRS